MLSYAKHKQSCSCRFSFMHWLLKMVGSVLLMFSLFLLTLVPQVGFPLLLVSFFALFVSYDCFPIAGQKVVG